MKAALLKQPCAPKLGLLRSYAMGLGACDSPGIPGWEPHLPDPW